MGTGWRLVEEGPERDLYSIQSRHLYGLPGLRCPEPGCGTWATTGIDYPQVEPVGVDLEPYRKSRAAEAVEYYELADRLRPWLPDHAVVMPGTKFGRSVVWPAPRAHPVVGDFVWPQMPGTVLVDERARDAIAGAFSGAVLVETAQKTPKSPVFWELYVPPSLRSLSHRDEDRCKACGRLGASGPMPLDVVEDPGAEHMPMARVRDFGTAVFARDELVELCATEGLTGIRFGPAATGTADPETE